MNQLLPRHIYRTNISLEEAERLWFNSVKERVNPLPEELIKTEDSRGRITSRPVRARISSPFFHASAMDGYAVRFSDTSMATERNPVFLRIGIDAIRLDTGDPLPEDFNAVVPLEDVNVVKRDGIEFIELREALTPWQNVRIAGEDIIAGELIISQNEIITPFHIGALLASQNREIWVRKRPLVSIIPTGAEMVDITSHLEEVLKPGNLIEFNSYFLGALLEETGAVVKRYPTIPDDRSALMDVLRDALKESNLIMIIGGSSLGREDYTPEVIKSLGEVVVHGVNIKPGKPVLLVFVEDKPVIGVPGYPVSAFISYELFVRPVIYMIQGCDPPRRDELDVVLSRNIPSTLGQVEFVRVKIGYVSGRYIATPLGRGAGLMSSLVKADGILEIPSSSEGIEGGSSVKVKLLRRRDELLNTIVFIGSHDNTIDLLANTLKRHYPSYSLSSANVGSMGGLLALRRRECHISGTHLLDEETGEFNIPFIKRILAGESVKVINLVYRQQGLMVKKGNPKSIKGFQDLLREDVVFINRQRGSGTRLLLDKCLRDLGIDPAGIKGYDMEDFTHMSVASKVATGVADAGLGIYSAAKAFDLDFIPVAEERYDLLILEEYLHLPMIRALIDIVREDREFRREVEALGGYDTRDMGKEIL